jgi:hypothetical protein
MYDSHILDMVEFGIEHYRGWIKGIQNPKGVLGN